MAEKKQNSSIDKMNFEDAIKELTGIVGKIEQGQIPLQESIEQYEKGMMLIRHCREILLKAEKRIEKISQSDDNKPQNSNNQDQEEEKEETEGNLPF
ncbi:MAG: exodeoxyribonuclease VII small subunit [Sedimentisphaerales bacterium]|nr:exodeoxyribonuclease VII small subunit [Sedimentisphaerales bacterium]